MRADTGTALGLYRLGDFPGAGAVYRAVLEQDPEQADALFGLGAIAFQEKRFEEAIGWLGRAVAAEPANAVLHSDLGAAYRAAGKLDEAETCYCRALELRPSFAEAYNNLGNLLRERGRLAEAITRYQQALLARPEYADAHFNLALAQQEQGQLEEALPHCLEAVRLRSRDARTHIRSSPCPTRADGEASPSEQAHQPAVPDIASRAASHLAAGEALAREGKLEEAVTAFYQAIRIEPLAVAGYVKLGTAFREQGKLEKSAAHLQHALRLQVNSAEAHFQLGLTLAEQGQEEEAETCYRESLCLEPNLAPALANLGSLLAEAGRHQEGQELIERALALNPRDVQAHIHFGSSLVNQGRAKEGAAQFFQALALNPDCAAAYYFLARDAKHAFTPEQVQQIQDLLQRPGLPLRDRIYLHFALARIFDREKSFDEAFRHAEQGNACKRELLALQGNTFQSEGHERFVDRLLGWFDEAYFRRVQSWGSMSELPVFIIGMPRSGTSLVEQILASHPAVHGGGELRNLKRFVLGLPAALGSGAECPECLQWLGPDSTRLLAEGYVNDLARLGPGKLRVTDKTPTNFHQLGLIATFWPRAVIIHCRRDPRDVCWSCYFQNFREVHYACDLTRLARYYRQYQRVMAHWKKVLPLPILEVCYEELVEDVEGLSRQIVSHCGLPWDDRCLTFYQTPRAVRTASNIQVRQPVYKHAVGHWKQYSRHLGPLQAVLDLPAAADAQV